VTLLVIVMASFRHRGRIIILSLGEAAAIGSPLRERLRSCKCRKGIYVSSIALKPELANHILFAPFPNK
jgi:hypothetical protein